VSAAQGYLISGIYAQHVNGWVIESLPSSGANYGGQIRSVYGNYNDGGIHVKGIASASYAGQQSLTDINLQSCGTGSGNLDVILFEDVQDIQGVNFNTSVDATGSGSSMHIKGACSTIYLANMDLGTFPHQAVTTDCAWLIEDGPNGSPADIRVTGAAGLQGLHGLRITGGASHVTFASFKSLGNQQHGISVEGTGTDISFTGLQCALNGQDKNSDAYDINWTGTAQGTVQRADLSTPVVSSGTAGVKNPCNLVSGNQVFAVDWNGRGAGTTSANMFANFNSPGQEHWVRPWQPRGGQVPSVPSSGTAVSPAGNDRWFYITASSSGTTSVSVSGATAASITIPAGACVPVFVPAGSTLTPTYTSVPTWVVFAN